MGLFKRAAARGVVHELVRRGLATFPSKEAAEEAADAVADAGAPPAMPEMSPDAGHSPEDLAAMGNKLIAMGQALMAQAGAAGPKTASEYTKYAAEADYTKAAEDAALGCMDRVAYETKQADALIHGGDKGNKPEQAAKKDEVAELDEKQRPQGTYQVARGDTALDTNKGQVGSSETSDKKPHESPSGENSVSRDAKDGDKAAAFRDVLRKMAAGALMMGGDTGGSGEKSDKNEMNTLDIHNRGAKNIYAVEPGGANFSEPQDARVGKEMKHPKAPARGVTGTNSVMQASKTSEEDAFLFLFQKCANDVGPYLPDSLSRDEKVAAISHMIGFSHDARQAYINELHKQSEEAAHKGGVADLIGAMHKEETKEPVAEKKKEEVGEKKEEHKKESALLATIRQIAASNGR